MQVCAFAGIVARIVAAIVIVLIAAPARAQSEQTPSNHLPDSPSRLRLVLGAEAALHSVDMFTTVRNLQLGGGNAREANPLLAPFARRPAALVLTSSAVNVLQIYTISRVHRRHPKLAVAWALALIGTEAYVVTHNVKVARQLQRARR
jgi:hypothetical protein